MTYTANTSAPSMSCSPRTSNTAIQRKITHHTTTLQTHTSLHTHTSEYYVSFLTRYLDDKKNVTIKLDGGQNGTHLRQVRTVEFMDEQRFSFYLRQNSDKTHAVVLWIDKVPLHNDNFSQLNHSTLQLSLNYSSGLITQTLSKVTTFNNR